MPAATPARRSCRWSPRRPGRQGCGRHKRAASCCQADAARFRLPGNLKRGYAEAVRDGDTPAYKYHPNARIAAEGRQHGFARRLETSPQAAARARRALKGSTTRDAVASFNVEAEQAGKTPMGAQNTKLLRNLAYSGPDG